MSDMKTRVRSAVKIGVFIALLYIFASVPGIFSLFAAIIGAFSVYEILSISNIITNEKWAVFFIFYAVTFPFIEIKLYVATELTLLIGVIMLFIFLFVDIKRAAVGTIPEWVAILVALVIPAMLKSIPELAAMENGVTYLSFSMMVSIFTDVFALIFGRLLGKRKLAPRISPNKTLEGAIFGTTLTIVIMLPLEYLFSRISGFEVDYLNLVLLSFFASVAGQFGDLSASVIKRMGGRKDYSDLIPGHGGILDRFDSMIFAIPIVYVLVNLGLRFAK